MNYYFYLIVFIFQMIIFPDFSELMFILFHPETIMQISYYIFIRFFVYVSCAYKYKF